jgi:hypothetical protein
MVLDFLPCRGSDDHFVAGGSKNKKLKTLIGFKIPAVNP